MDATIKVAVWALIVVLVAGQFSDILQAGMMEAGIISKKIEISDACKYDMLPLWFKDVLNCEKQPKKKSEKATGTKKKLDLKLDLGDDLMQQIKFEAREKTCTEQIVDYFNKLWLRLKRLLLLENITMPCLFGDCDMDKKIKLEKQKYENLLGRKVDAREPEQHVETQIKKPDTIETKRKPDL